MESVQFREWKKLKEKDQFSLDAKETGSVQFTDGTEIASNQFSW